MTTRTETAPSRWDRDTQDREKALITAQTGIWQSYEPARAIECRVWFIAEEAGGYSAILPHLPGAVSQGESIEEAERNVREAIAGVVAAYRGEGRLVPWQHDDEEVAPSNAQERWLVVDV